MPWPESRTSRTASLPARRSVRSTRPLSGVNLTAFDRRFERLCCRRSGSATTGPTVSSTSTLSAIDLAAAAGCTASTAAATTAAGSTSLAEIRSLPVMMREMSSRPSMSWASEVVLRSIVSSARSRRSSSKLPRRSHQIQPMSAFSGVRSSCESVARKDRKSTRLNSSHLVISYAVSLDRKSTRLNSSHLVISYAVFCLKKKNLLYDDDHLPPNDNAPHVSLQPPLRELVYDVLIVYAIER